MFPDPPSLRRIAFAATGSALGAVAVICIAEGFSSDWVLRVLESAAVFAFGAALLVAAASLVIMLLGGWRESDAEFDRLVDRTEALARSGEDDRDPLELADPVDYDTPDSGRGGGPDFGAALRQALAALPLEQHRALEYVEIEISDSRAARGGRGRRLGPYGAVRAGEGPGAFEHRIVLFRDRLLRDFGDDPELLTAQITTMLGRELARLLTRSTQTH